MTTDRVLRASQDSRFADRSSTAQDAALRGASLAFGKPPVKPKPNLNTYTGDDGALAAARGVGGGRGATGVFQQDRLNTPVKPNNTGDQLGIGRQNTGGSLGMVSPKGGSAKRSNSRPRMGRLDGNGFLQPSRTPGAEGKSASFIAATLAASRSASVSPNLTGQKMSGPELRPKSSFTRSPSSKRSSSKESSDYVLDTTSIPPTTSLIGMFEQNAKVQTKERESSAMKKTISPVADFAANQRKQLSLKPRTPSPPLIQQNTTNKSLKSSNPNLIAPIPLKPSQPVPTMRFGNVPQLKPKPKPKPQASDPQKTPVKVVPRHIEPAQSDNESTSSNDSFVSASDSRPTPPPPRQNTTPKHRQRLTSASAVSLDSAMTTNNKINSMANAIVASSLASSRAGSPSKQSLQPPLPPPSRRGSRGIFYSHKEASRTPSPSKQGTLRTTMRKPKTEPEVDEGDKRRTKKHNLMKKHPNKHHEGDRKRWRDEITERERKRYEAVWASNKGLHVPPLFSGWEFCVCNLVVKDIFSRSRLHADELEEVYALVDRKGNGTLEKEEFVVGLWLVDQRLKGKKLPIRVSDHIWRSVGALQGIKVRKAYHGN